MSKTLKELNLEDDFLFAKVMSDKEICKEFLEKLLEIEIEKIEKLGYENLPICIAKTQYSFSDDAKNLECKDEYNIHVRNVELKTGAGFIVALAGKIMTMPGLPKIPAAENIDIDENGNIEGIF